MTQKTKEINERAGGLLEKLDTKRLIEMFIETGYINDKDIPAVRGWLMDEIERRNPEGFEKWLDGDAEDSELGHYILS